MDKDAKKKIVTKSRDISSLKSDLTKTSDKKEETFKRLKNIKKEIFKLINNIRSVKKESDDVNEDVIELKKNRDEYNKKVKELISKVKELNNKKRELIKKNKIKGDPVKIKQRIEKLEESIEINAYSYEKEQKVMEEIKKLKKVYSSYDKLTPVVEELSKVSKEIDELRKKSGEAHNLFKKAFREGRRDQREFSYISKRINELKDKQKKMYDLYKMYRNEYSKLNELLNLRLKDVSQVRRDIDMKRLVDRERILKRQREEIEARKRDVEQKLKKGGKLTTEDLIVYQEENK